MNRFARQRIRALLFATQNGLCAICGKDLGIHYQIDHITPWARGGLTLIKNLQALCFKCHQMKTCEDFARGKELS